MSAIHLKEKPARNFMAILMVDSKGDAALDACAKDGPMWKAVKAEIEYRKQQES